MNFLSIPLGLLAVLYSALILGSVALQEVDPFLPSEGSVYVMNNELGANIIVHLVRDRHGALVRTGEYATGGLGSGPAPLPARFGGPGPGPLPLDSADSLVAARNGRFLLAVNAGSNDISVMQITRAGLKLIDKKPSGGVYPVSIAYRDGLVYVINLGGAPTLQDSPGIPTMSGFQLHDDGHLEPVPGSTRVIGEFGSGPADAAFSPDGRFLVVTLRVVNSIAVFPVSRDGVPGAESLSPSNNLNPFGIAFTHEGSLLVTEAVDDGPRNPRTNGSTTSSYRILEDGSLETISRSVATNQTAACWIRLSKNEKFAYVVNSGSGSISTYAVSSQGELGLLLEAAGDAGRFGAPIDEAITPDGKYLYVDSPLLGALIGFRINQDGSLTRVSRVEGFPVSLSGIVAW